MLDAFFQANALKSIDYVTEYGQDWPLALGNESLTHAHAQNQLEYLWLDRSVLLITVSPMLLLQVEPLTCIPGSGEHASPPAPSHLPKR